jgi:tetratricopeptide (TPR) repeat protein
LNLKEHTLESILRLLPEVEELEELRTAIVRVAVPDPAMEWSRSGSLSTVDKRLVEPDRLAAAIDEAEHAFNDSAARLFAAYRSIARAIDAGAHEDVVAELVALGEQKEQAGLFRSARRYLETAVTVSLPLPEKGPQVLALRRLGRVCRAAGELNEAIRHYDRSGELARDARDVKGQVIARIGAGHALALQGRWADAEQTHLDALGILADADDDANQLERGQIYNNLGYFTARQDQLDEAEGWLARASEVWAEISSPADVGVCHHTLALVRKKKHDWAGAIRHYQTALEVPLPAALRAGISIDAADAAMQDGDEAGAERWGRMAEEEAISARSAYFLGRVYQVRGNLARAADRDDGFTFYEKALEIARDRGLRLLEGETLMDYAQLRARMGETDEARSYLERAAEIFAEAGAMIERERAGTLLATLSGAPPEVDPIASPGD